MRGDSHSHSAFDARMSVKHVRAATWARCGLWRRSGESVGGHIPGFGLTRGRAGVPSGLGGKATQAKMVHGARQVFLGFAAPPPPPPPPPPRQSSGTTSAAVEDHQHLASIGFIVRPGSDGSLRNGLSQQNVSPSYLEM